MTDTSTDAKVALPANAAKPLPTGEEMRAVIGLLFGAEAASALAEALFVADGYARADRDTRAYLWDIACNGGEGDSLPLDTASLVLAPLVAEG